ncbi:MAG TPA: hypothetical protein VFP35_01830 [Candidatus Saccharimonadales bacterium]|nr:hypothetical protein [Candidatus Saccharimonadales bacterium]
MREQSVKFYQEHDPQPLIQTVFEQQRQRIDRLTEPQAPLETLGDIALTYLMGGAMAHTGLLPRTETIVLEGLAATVKTADQDVQVETQPSFALR